MSKLPSLSRAAELPGVRTAKVGFRPDIEGLRAVAVVAVVLFHADVPGLGGGYVGVDVFFVISGFLITGLLWREVSSVGTVRLRRFYGARARRLLPASATVGVVTAIATVFWLPPLQAQIALGDGIASALYISNFWFGLQGIDYLAPYLPESPYLHYWSLSVEEQFYLVWPAMMIGTAWLIRRVRQRSRGEASSSQRPFLVVLAFIAAISFVLSLVATYVLPYFAFFSLPTRAWQLAVGGLLALTASRWSRLPARTAAIAGWAGLAIIVLSCTMLSTDTYYPGVAALLPVLGTMLVIGAGCASASHGCGRVLSLSPMQAVGRVSYSWYLWHWPVLLFAPLLLGDRLGLPGRLAAVLVSLGLAVLTLKLIENPLRFAPSVRRSPARSLALGGAFTAIAVCVCVVLMASVPVPVGRGVPLSPLTVTAADSDSATVQQAFAQVQSAVAGAAGLKDVPSNLDPSLSEAATELSTLYAKSCMLKLFQVKQPECTAGDPNSTTTVALVGDSHAAMWTPAFQQIAEQRGWRLETMAKASCPLMSEPATNLLRRLASSDCAQWRGEIINQLRAERPQLIVISMWRGYGIIGHSWLSGFTSYDRAWNASLTDLVQQLRTTGAKVLVLGPIPDPHELVPTCLSGHLDDATACSTARSTAVNDTGIAAEAAATDAAGGQYVDMTELFCTAARCPSIVGNSLVYFDWTHMTSAYSRRLAPAISMVADRALAGG